MKKNIVLSLLLMLVLCLTGLVSCQTQDPPPESTPIPVISEDASDYIIIYPENNTTWRKYAIELSNKLSITGVRIQMATDAEDPVAKEILVGPTNRPLSIELATEIARADAEDYAWGVHTSEQTIAMYASGSYAWERCLAYLTDASYVSAEGVTFPSYTWDLQLLTLEEREAELNAGKVEDEEAARKEKEERYETILNGIGAFDIEDFGGSIITTDLGGRWAAPTETPIDEHPRLLFTSDDLPNLRKTFTDTKNYPELVAAFESLYNSTSDGKLGERYERTDHSPGNYNYEPKELIIIQAKALQYLLSGDEFYGYDAIYSLLNNIQTLDIGYFKDDQWRRYGHTMYTAALVYDWCYDLLDADTKMLIISGVEHLLCSGTSSMPDKAHWGGVKMEMGFPPVKEGGTIVGHSSETQFMRDYLSFAIAIFDEVPGWWEMIAGRLYEEYVPPREYIYSAGMFPEGTAEYAQMRFMTDLRAIWLLEKAVGESPYDSEDVSQIVRSFLGHEVADGYVFTTGDGGVPRNGVATFAGCGFMHAYLFGDDVVMSMIREVYGDTFNYVTYDHTQLSPIEVLICLSETDTSNLTENWRDEVDLIQYNDSFYQQIIVMNKRNDEDTVAVLLKGAGHSSGGHDHESIGNFQIYYKGILTADAGVYDTYGTNHHYYYHEATIGHNSLLIYNSSLKYTLGGFYSGGQEKLNNTATGPSWITDTWYDTGVVTGVSYGYLDEEQTSPRYVYYANNMTKAYNSQTVEYVGRTMLVTYTKDETFPMVMFVFDNITAKQGSYQKTFLLQCVKEPTISGNTVTVDNGSGKLVLTALKGGDSIKSYGGENQFYINGADKIVNPTYSSSSGPMWGRVEVCPATGNKTDYLMNVMYVTDSGTTEKVTPTLIESDTYIGAKALNQTAIFMKSTNYVTTTVSFQSTGAGKTMNYYVGGIADGKWTVKVGSTTVGTFDVSDAEHFLTFTTNASGNVTLTPAG